MISKHQKIIRIPVERQEDCSYGKVLVTGNELVKEAEKTFLRFFDLLFNQSVFYNYINFYDAHKFCTLDEMFDMCEDPPMLPACPVLRDDFDYCYESFKNVNVNYLISHVAFRVLKNSENEIEIFKHFKDNYKTIQSNNIDKKFSEQYRDIYDAIEYTIEILDKIKTRLEKLNIGKAEKILKLGKICRGAGDGEVSEKDKSINCAYLAKLVAKDLYKLTSYSVKQYNEIHDRYEKKLP
ncbi:hypothetical protein AYI69_g8836 [Smittium culicis]|uniref:Uncharacterized protein n=1 Tax=Smittium culicis TaxID=133412 RepID=A0A1R1XGT5_9FUNG|nr:hypothetical protein AYI69_g8836 [Smittium culicis]